MYSRMFWVRQTAIFFMWTIHWVKRSDWNDFRFKYWLFFWKMSMCQGKRQMRINNPNLRTQTKDLPGKQFSSLTLSCQYHKRMWWSSARSLTQKVLSFHRADIPHLSLDCGFLHSLTAVSSKNIIYPCNTCKSGSNAISLLGFVPQRVLALSKACRTKNGTEIQVPSLFSSWDAARIPVSGNCDTP